MTGVFSKDEINAS